MDYHEIGVLTFDLTRIEFWDYDSIQVFSLIVNLACRIDEHSTQISGACESLKRRIAHDKPDVIRWSKGGF